MADDSPTNQEISNPDDKQDKHPIKQHNYEALEQRNEDHVFDTEEPQISNIQRVDSEVGQVYEIEGRVEGDKTPRAEQTGHQEKEGLYSDMETLQSKTDDHYDSQPEQDDTSFHPIGKRRKLASSRRSKGRRHVKGSAESNHEHKEEDVESTRGNEAFESAEMLLPEERASQEGLSQGSEHDLMPVTHDSSLYSAIMSGYSSEVQNAATTNYSEADWEALIPKREFIQEDHDERETNFKVEMSDKSVGATLEGTDKYAALQSQEVRGDHQDALNELHGQEVTPAESQEMPENDHSPETLIDDVTKHSGIISGNLMEQSEINETYHSDLTVKGADDSPTNQEMSNPNDKEEEHPTKENNVETLAQKVEDYHFYDIKDPQISDIERVDTAPGQVYEIESRVEADTELSAEETGHQEKEGLFSEMEESELFSQTWQSEIDADFVSDLETTEMSLTTETVVQGKSMDTMLEELDNVGDAQTEDVRDQVKEDVLVGISNLTSSSSTVDQQTIDHSNVMEMPDEEPPNVSSVIDKENKEGDEDKEWFRQDGNKEAHDSEDKVHEDEVKPTENQATPQIDYSPESVIHDATEHSGIISGNLMEQTETSDTYQSELTVKMADDSPTNQEISNPDDKQDEHPTKQNNHESDYHVDEYINPIGKRRKLGSSRRNKGRQHVNDSAAESSIKPTEEVVGNTSDNEDLETREMSLTTETEVQEKSMDKVLVGMDTAQTEDVSDQVKENDLVDIDSMYSNFKGDQSDFMVPDDELPEVCSITERESMESDYDKESGDKDSTITREISKENNSPEDLTDIECSVDEPLDTETMKQEEFKKQTDLDFKATGEMRKTRANLNENMSEEDTHLSQTVMDNNAVVTTDRTSSPGEDSVLKYNKEVNEENIFINLTHSLSQPTGCDTVKTDSIPSPEVSRHKETNMQQHDDASDTVGDTVYVQVYEQEEETGKKVYEATHAGLFSAANNKTDTLAPFNVGLEENIPAEPAVGVSEGSEISSQQDMEEETNLDDSGNVQGRSKQRRRKMGSTRRDQLNRKPEGKRVETKESDIRGLDETEAVEGLTMIETAEISQNENAKPPLSPVYEGQQEPSETRTVDDEMQKLQRSDLQGLQNDMRSDMEDSEALPPEQSASHNEKDDAALFVHVAEIGASERNAGVEPSQVDDFTTSVFAGINTINLLLSSNTEDITNTDEETPESENVRHDQVLKSAAEASVVADLEMVKSAVEGGGTAETSEQEPDNVNEGAGTEDLEMKNTGPPIDSTSRRRKMGSTRRNLISRAKQEDLQQKQRADEEAPETASDVGDVKTESLLGIIEEQLQLHLEPPAHRTFEENPVSHSEQAETEQSAPSDPPALPSTSPKHESESASGGRRRKMGSHRKSHGHQNDEKQTTRGDKITDTQSGGDESTVKTSVELKEESLGRDKTPKVDQSDKEPLSSPSEEGEHSRPVSAKTPKPATPVQHLYAEIRLGQGSPQTLSLGNSIGAEFSSTASNVMMVGDSSVGKTSFMKRAHSGKFSLDIPASVGLDSCMWTVVVDGKPVVLQLWDTAGQERFHSITRQIFHKAHAFLLMYDITSSQSFSAVSYWASCIQEGAAENVTVVLVGNKNDRADRQVKTQEAELLAKEYNFEFMECSAATGENVVQSLETVARLLSQKADTREDAATVLQKEPQQKKSSGCC